MVVRRIVTDIKADDPSRAKAFYGDIFGLELKMDGGFIQTCGAEATQPIQISFACEGGSGTAVPTMSIEVDNVDAVLTRIKEAGFEVRYGPVDEPWGVRRFFVVDPFGQLVNVLSHLSET
ncbi:MAG: VOC family protein [Marinibacterium sp.]